jgi:arylformamidase
MEVGMSEEQGTASSGGEIGGGWRDVSVPLHNGMVHWPDNPPVSIERMLDISKGDNANVSALSMGSHTGTHMDAPVHFLNDGLTLDRMDLGATLGRARVIQIDDEEAIRPEAIQDEEIEPGDRIIFRTRNSFTDWWLEPFKTDFIFLSHEAAELLVERQARTVGVDYLSVGGYKRDGAETHRALLSAGIWIMEGLRLNEIEPGYYELICLPMLISGADGAPARALLRPITPS